MSDMSPLVDRFDIGRVVQLTFGLISRNLAVFLMLTVVLVTLPAGVGEWLQLRMLGAGGAATVLWRLAMSFVAMIGAFLLQASLVHGSVADLNGRRASFGDCLATGARSFAPVAAIGLITGLAMVFGFVFLIVPALMLATAWAVVVPAAVVERAGVFGSIRRSARLTRGSRWRVFGVIMIYLVIYVVVLMAFTGLGAGAGAAAGRWAVGLAIAQLVIQTASSLVGAVGVSAIYFELRRIKEGVGPEALASVFD